uniref:WD repeat domain 46 n=1 Tax=Accipiter nisus TaxID=211598 RepID=A0A8B9NP45_9AVES
MAAAAAAAANGGRSRTLHRRQRAGPGPAASASHGGERGDTGSVSGVGRGTPGGGSRYGKRGIRGGFGTGGGGPGASPPGTRPRSLSAQRKDPFPGPPAPALAPEAVGAAGRSGGRPGGSVGPAAPRGAGVSPLCVPRSVPRVSPSALLCPLTPPFQRPPRFLEADPGEDTCTITQGDIAEAVDIASAAKHFDLRLEQFGPYRLDYTRNGRHLLLGGRRGHVAAMDWQTKALMCEINVMETVTDVAWLHTETLLAVAQRRWLHVYDNQGLELNCLKSFPGVLQLQFLPYHFLLATANDKGFLQYLDISVGKEVAALCTRGGRLAVMAQNPANAIIHLGHSNGTVTLWSPTVSEPLVRMLCHRGALRALAVDPTGTYMASAGLDRKLRVFDLRTYRVLQELVLPQGAGHLAFSQRGVLAAACGRVAPTQKPGGGKDNNPYRSRRQRQEWEVKALLEKIPAELITLDPTQLGCVDTASLQQKREERIQRLGFDPQAKAKFKPRRRAKGNNLLHRKRKVAHEEQRAVIRQSVEQREQEKKKKRKERRKEESSPPPKRGALDRFKK